MSVASAAVRFDKTTATDVFGTATFKCQVLPSVDTVRSGSALKLRILSTGPGISIPTRRVVTTGVENLIVSAPSIDYFKGAAIRANYSALPVVDQYTVRTISNIVNGDAGQTDLYAVPFAEGLQSVLQTSSDKVLTMSLLFSRYESIPVDSILSLSGKTYRAISPSYVDGAGFGVVDIIDLGSSSIKTVTVVSLTGKDPVTEIDTTVTYTGKTALCCLSEVFYSFSDADRKAVEAGDVSYWLSKTIVVSKPGTGSTVDGRRVVACKENPSGVWEVRTRV